MKQTYLERSKSLISKKINSHVMLEEQIKVQIDNNTFN